MLSILNLWENKHNDDEAYELSAGAVCLFASC